MTRQTSRHPGKADRARIRVEHIIREDYLVEAMEVLEMFCDLILARIGLVSNIIEFVFFSRSCLVMTNFKD